MNKKKICSLIILSSLIFYVISNTVNFYSTYMRLKSNFQNFSGQICSAVCDYITHNESESLYQNLKESDISLTDYYAFWAEGMTVGTYPHQVAILNEDNAVVSKSETAVYIEPNIISNTFIKSYLINLEDYITPELKKELLRFKFFNSGFPDVEYITFYYNGEKYIPVELCFEGSSSRERKSFYLSEETPNITFESKKYNIWFNLCGVDEKIYEKGFTAMLSEKMKEERYRRSHYTGTTTTKTYFIEIDGEYYQIYVALKYHPFFRTVTSASFIKLTLLITVLFSFATGVLLYLYLKLYNKGQQLEKSKRTFISAAAHELKTPLAVIQNQCECILEDVLPEKNDEYIRSVYDEALRMNDIVTSLLTFNRLSATDKVHKDNVNLSDLVIAEVNKYLTFAEAKGVKIISADITESLYVSCNSELMALAIDNYLSNAVKYTTGEKKITVSLTKTKKGFLFEVFNTAEPIDESEIKGLWNVLERQDSSRTRKENSTGMGLPICKRIFDIHSFKYECRNADGGIIFSIMGEAIK